ncbi:hypothetical protein HQN64_19005 [Enterobacteriaceae bacterium BIT-l23]|uniref:hypothetical protein n=1 Tax=Jejubacter sp. L23 TaxID=3092086 RepID=UPI0015859709|nr:hypothetical protein [Enterobacteriaceae bacterium BIT-l23]
MRLLALALLAISTAAFADDSGYGDPVSRCLNNHTIPYIKSDIDARKIVDDAYKECDSVIKEWQSNRELLPKEMRDRQEKELYEFYIRMIEIRRKSEPVK